MKEEDINFLKQAIDNSITSKEQGNFPAGAVLVKDGSILASTVSSPFPGLHHADSKAIAEAFEKNKGPLIGATLYVGLEPCLMCTATAYWGGVRRVVYACSKDRVNPDYYETPEDAKPLVDKFNSKMELVHAAEFEGEALSVVQLWEKENGS